MHVGREFVSPDDLRTYRWYKHRHLDFFRSGSSNVASAAARKREMAARNALAEIAPLTFNGAREEATKHSPLGTQQAWSIDHLDPEQRSRNREGIAKVAQILLDYPELVCEIHGETSTPYNNVCDPDLAGYFGKDPDTELQAVMDGLAHERAKACLEALVERGVPKRRLSVSYQGCSGQQRVSFMPSIDENAMAVGGGADRSDATSGLWSDVRESDASLAAAQAQRRGRRGSLLAQPNLRGAAYGIEDPSFVRAPARLPGAEEGADYFQPQSGDSAPAAPPSAEAPKSPLPPIQDENKPPEQIEIDLSRFPNLRPQAVTGGGNMAVL